MPTEELFKRTRLTGSTLSKWSSSRDNRGMNPLAYVDPDTFRPLTDRLTLGDYLNLTAAGQVLTLFEPQARARFGYTASELRSLQVSPNIKAGIYDGNATALVYYMDDQNQYTVAYRLTKLADLQLSQLIDPADLTTGERIRLQIREFLLGLVPTDVEIRTGSETLDSLIESIQDRFDYSQFLAVWTVAGSVSQPLDVVTSAANGGSSRGSANGATSSSSTDRGSVLLPLALIGGGLFAGAPLIALGGGALLLLTGREDDNVNTSPTISGRTDPSAGFTFRGLND